MQILNSSTTDIYYNLALEEYLLKHRTNDFFILWQSEQSIVVGKHQNVMAEINHRYVRDMKIPVARRLSGGGTVYHGPGNINFTFIINGKDGKLVDFKRFVSPIIDYLKTLHIEAQIGTRNDLLIDGLKISGNAEHVFKERVLHHGTLLFNADLTMLNTSIAIKKGRYRDKAVQSNRSEVTNIANYLKKEITIEVFKAGLLRFMGSFFKGAEIVSLAKDELAVIQKLRNEKYHTPEWIYNYSPPFEVTALYKKRAINLKVVKGIIRELTDDRQNEPLPDELRNRLVGVRYLYSNIEKALMHCEKCTTDELLNSLFG